MSQTKAQLIDPTDGSIVNADINASAAIAGSKISPAFSANITTTGNAVIGGTTINTAQDKALSIFGTNGSELKLQATNFGGTAADGGAALTCTFGSFFITNNNPNGKIHFQTKVGGQSTSEKMVLTQDGKLGIGITSPAELLHLQSTAGNTKLRLTQSGSTTDQINGAIHFGNSTDGQLCEIRGYTSGSTNSGYLQFLTTSSGSDVTAMTIATSGNVGIGTASPTNQLHVYDGAAANDTPEIKIESFRPAIRFKDRSGSSVSSEIVGDNALLFRVSTPVDDSTALTERMRIDSSGRLILNQTSTSIATKIVSKVAASSNAAWEQCGLAVTHASGINRKALIGFGFSGNGGTNPPAAIGSISTDTASFENAALVFYTRTATTDTEPSERLRIEPNGFLSGAYKPVKTVKNTNQDHTTGERFVIPLPSTSRMFKIAGTFSWSGSGSGIIFADFGDWSDSHTVDIEGVALSFRNGASEDLDDLGNSRYQRVTPQTFDASNLEIQYEIFITSQAFQNGNDTGNNAGGGRPGAFGHIRFTHSGVGVALTTFVFQDINATGTDRLQSFAWDIDGSTGTLGSGEHTYVIEEYPLT